MPQLGMQELILIFVVALLVFGPRKLPELGKSLGKGLREFKRATNEMKATWDDQMRDVEREVRETSHDIRKVEREIRDESRTAGAPPTQEEQEEKEEKPVKPAEPEVPANPVSPAETVAGHPVQAPPAGNADVRTEVKDDPSSRPTS